jgi:hypothetical protein
VVHAELEPIDARAEGERLLYGMTQKSEFSSQVSPLGQVWTPAKQLKMQWLLAQSASAEASAGA